MSNSTLSSPDSTNFLNSSNVKLISLLFIFLFSFSVLISSLAVLVDSELLSALLHDDEFKYTKKDSINILINFLFIKTSAQD